MRVLARAGATTLLLAACGGGGETPTGSTNNNNNGNGGNTNGVTSPVAVTIRFDARVSGAPLACGTPYPGLGTTGSTVTVRDLRMFVHAVRLVTEGGTEVPVTLTPDSRWQLDDVALLDFETGVGECSNGTPETNLRVVGTAPAGTYRGLRFAVGVPFARNHINPATAPAPLSLTAMAWSWNLGYLFFRAELATTGQPGGYSVHLGSTGCNGATATTPPTACAQPNRPEVRLDAFDAATQVVVVDLGRLLAGSDLDVNLGGASGCQAAPADADCAPIFARFGLPFGGAVAGAQVVFSAGAP